MISFICFCFQERQRDKDSPYNFNVPPQLSIDLDTYEKTGETKVKTVKSEVSSNQYVGHVIKLQLQISGC